MAPQVGDIVEDFTLPDQDGNPVSLSDFKGKTVVLFFYPKADTPGCTIEACEFRDNFPKFKNLQDEGVVILGISRDTSKAQKKFAEKFQLPYTLLADADQEIVKRFDLVKPKTMYGKLVSGVERTTYITRTRPAPGSRLREGQARRPRRRSPRTSQELGRRYCTVSVTVLECDSVPDVAVTVMEEVSRPRAAASAAAAMYRRSPLNIAAPPSPVNSTSTTAIFPSRFLPTNGSSSRANATIGKPAPGRSSSACAGVA